MLILISSHDRFRDSYSDLIVFTNAARRITQHARDVGLAISRRANRWLQLRVAIHPQHLSFPRTRFSLALILPIKEATIVIREAINVRKYDTRTHRQQAVTCDDALDRLQQTPASHALPLEMARLLASRNRDDLQIVEQNFELTNLVFAIEPQILKIAKKRTQCAIFRWCMPHESFFGSDLARGVFAHNTR